MANSHFVEALAEQIKLPLTQIARLSELSQSTKKPAQHLHDIELTAQNALQFIDSYLLSSQLHKQLELEPVSLSAVLQNTAQQLQPYARHYECDIELHICGKYEPVMAHAAGLQAALASLGYVFIESQEHKGKKRPVLTLAAHRGKSGIVAGVFTTLGGLSVSTFKKAHDLHHRARQPLSEISSNNGAGVFVAESILDAMSAQLRVAKHHKLTGLAATFLPSQQLALV